MTKTQPRGQGGVGKAVVDLWRAVVLEPAGSPFPGQNMSVG